LTVRSAIEIDTRNPEHPKLNLEVVIDGKVAYKWVAHVIPFEASGILIETLLARPRSLPIQATPVKLRSSTALGSMVPDGLKDILDRVGLSPNRWF
jgi:alkaline phosphatase D